MSVEFYRLDCGCVVEIYKLQGNNRYLWSDITNCFFHHRHSGYIKNHPSEDCGGKRVTREEVLTSKVTGGKK
jgi:hypothetical protein